MTKSNEKLLSIMSVKFTNPLSFQTKKVNQHTGGKGLIHGTKHDKDN